MTRYSLRWIVGVTVLVVVGIAGIFWLIKREKLHPFRGGFTLEVGMMSGYAPFMFVNEKGAFEGFDVDFAHELGRRLGRQVKIYDMGLAELLVALEKGKIDLLISGLTITPERKKTLQMVHYHGGNLKTLPLVFWNKIIKGILTFDDVVKKNLSVLVESGSSWDECLDVMQVKNRKLFSRYLDMVMELRAGRADAILFDPDIIGWFQKQFPELRIVQLPLEGKFEVDGLGVGIRKDNKTLKDTVEWAVDAMRRDGTIGRFEKNWGLSK